MCILWLSSKAMTVRVDIDIYTGRITFAAPIVKRFLGQDILHLISWMEKQGNFRMEILD